MSSGELPNHLRLATGRDLSPLIRPNGSRICTFHARSPLHILCSGFIAATVSAAELIAHCHSFVMFRLGTIILLILLLGCGHAIEMDCGADGECTANNDPCGLYIAESTIPFGGLGVFLGTEAKGGSVIDTVSDILVPDIEENRLIYEYLSNETLPSWSLSDITWEFTGAKEADAVAVVSGGIGSLANIHLGLFNVEKVPCSRFRDLPRTDPMVGSKSPYEDCSYRMTQDATAGSELFLSPASRNILDTPRSNPSFQEIWDRISYGLGEAVASELWETIGKRNVSALNEVPNLPTRRPVEWLKEHGVCIDQVHVMDQSLFAKKDFKTNSVVTTSPIRVLSRAHLDITLLDRNSEPKKEIMWQGKQLLVNSCYGDPSSSLLFLPLDSRVQAINHPRDGQTANLGIRWSSRLSRSKEFFEMSPPELLKEAKAGGLSFDFYALSDIAAGDKLLIDHGAAWEKAWSEHVRSWAPNRIVHSEDYISAEDYGLQCRKTITLTNDHACMMNVPTWITLGCSTRALEKAGTIAESINSEAKTSCRILSVDSKGLYSVRVGQYSSTLESLVVEGLAVDDITFTNRPYTSNQFLRSAFRHEIGIPSGKVLRFMRQYALTSLRSIAARGLA